MLFTLFCLMLSNTRECQISDSRVQLYLPIFKFSSHPLNPKWDRFRNFFQEKFPILGKNQC